MPTTTALDAPAKAPPAPESAHADDAARTIGGYLKCMRSRIKRSGRGEQNAEMLLVSRTDGVLSIEDYGGWAERNASMAAMACARASRRIATSRRRLSRRATASRGAAPTARSSCTCGSGSRCRTSCARGCRCRARCARRRATRLGARLVLRRVAGGRRRGGRLRRRVPRSRRAPRRRPIAPRLARDGAPPVAAAARAHRRAPIASRATTSSAPRRRAAARRRRRTARCSRGRVVRLFARRAEGVLVAAQAALHAGRLFRARRPWRSTMAALVRGPTVPVAEAGRPGRAGGVGRSHPAEAAIAAAAQQFARITHARRGGARRARARERRGRPLVVVVVQRRRRRRRRRRQPTACRAAARRRGQLEDSRVVQPAAQSYYYWHANRTGAVAGMPQGAGAAPPTPQRLATRRRRRDIAPDVRPIATFQLVDDGDVVNCGLRSRAISTAPSPPRARRGAAPARVTSTSSAASAR